MVFTDDKFIPSGSYAIVNVAYNRPIFVNEQGECLSTSSEDYYGWTITFLQNKKWTIQGPHGVFLDMPPDAEEGEDVVLVKNPPKPHQWVIKRHSNVTHAYIIYSPSQPQLFLGLPNEGEGTSPRLCDDHDGDSNFWKFTRIEQPESNVETIDPMKRFSAAPVQRPTQLESPVKHVFAITIPAGWLTTVSSISCGNSVNLVRVRRIVNGALEGQDLVSSWDAIDKAMSIDGSSSDALTLSSLEDPYVLVIEVYHSKNRARKDPRKLPGFRDFSTDLRAITTSRPNDVKCFPDFQLFTIFDESPDSSGQGLTQNALITVHASMRVNVDLNDPGKPESDRVNKGYNEDLDRPRPNSMDNLLEKYHLVFLVDDSSSMSVNGAWGKAKDAILLVAAEVTQYDTSGIDIYFLNSLSYQDGIRLPAQVVRLFGTIKPQGPSRIGARLEFVINKIMDQLERAKHNAADYEQVKPFNIMVLTNSPPSDDPAKILRFATKKLGQGLHHPNSIAIQFVQIGNDQGAEKALKKLTDDPSFNIADTVSFGAKFTPENLQKAVLGAMHPSIRAKVAGSSGLQCLYYRVFDNERAVVTKRPAYLNDLYVGRIRSRWVAPPHTAASLRLCLSSMENIDGSKTKLFATPSSQAAIPDATPVALRINQTLGLSPEEPLVLLSEVPPKDGLRPGTESLRVPPDAQSPLVPRFLYYGVYNEGGATASKEPINEEEVWISRVDLDHIPPPLSVASLMRLISKKEGTTGSSQLFADQDQITLLKDDHILTDQGCWPGSTADDYVTFKVTSRPPVQLFKEGTQYKILNAATGKALTMYPSTCPGRNLYLFNLPGGPVGYGHKALDFTFKHTDDGGVAARVQYDGQWVGPDFQGHSEAYSLYFVPSESNADQFFIFLDADRRRVFHDPEAVFNSYWGYYLGIKDFDAADRRQMWYLGAPYPF